MVAAVRQCHPTLFSLTVFSLGLILCLEEGTLSSRVSAFIKSLCILPGLDLASSPGSLQRPSPFPTVSPVYFMRLFPRSSMETGLLLASFIICGLRLYHLCCLPHPDPDALESGLYSFSNSQSLGKLWSLPCLPVCPLAFYSHLCTLFCASLLLIPVVTPLCLLSPGLQ